LSQTTEVKPSQLSKSLAEAAALEEIKGQEENQSLKSAWITLGNQLEMDGVLKETIQTIASDLIRVQLSKKTNIPKEEINLSGHFYRVFKESGWSTNELDDAALGREKTVLIYSNKSMIELCYDLIDVLRIVVEKSKNDKINLNETFGKEEMDEFYFQQKSIISNIQNAIDHKTKVPENTEIFLLEILATTSASVNKCGEIFMEENLLRLKDQSTLSKRTGKPVPFLTPKQATKYTNGESISKQFLLKPPTRDFAVYLKYTGQECTCGSFLIRNRVCFDCKKKHQQSHVSKCEHCNIPLWKERLLYIAENGKCEECKEIVDLPEEMIQYAKS